MALLGLRLTTPGPRIRITPNTILFRSPTAYRDIYNHKANVQKAPFYEAWQKDKNDVNTFTTRDRKAHAARRKMLNQSFTEQSLRASQPFMIKHVDRWNELLVAETDDDQWSKPANFADLSDMLVFDIMGDLCFGTSFDIKEPGKNPFKSIPHAIVQYMQFFYPVSELEIDRFVFHTDARETANSFAYAWPHSLAEATRSRRVFQSHHSSAYQELH